MITMTTFTASWAIPLAILLFFCLMSWIAEISNSDTVFIFHSITTVLIVLEFLYFAVWFILNWNKIPAIIRIV